MFVLKSKIDITKDVPFCVHNYLDVVWAVFYHAVESAVKNVA